MCYEEYVFVHVDMRLTGNIVISMREQYQTLGDNYSSTQL